MSFRVARLLGLVARRAGRLWSFAFQGPESTRLSYRLAIYGRWPTRVP